MDVDAEGEEGEAVEGEEAEGEEAEGEEEEVEGQSVAGMVRARGGRVVPMYRWISSIKVVGGTTPLVSVVDSKKEDGDVQMADATDPSTQSNAEEKRDTKLTEEKHMVLSFSVPVPLLSSSSPSVTASDPGSGSVSRAETPTHTAVPPATKVTPAALTLPVRPPAAICAVDGCEVKRKYRLVSDWTKGACGMEHLKVLEGRV